MSKAKKIVLSIVSVFAVLILICVSYVLYYVLSYKRVGDNIDLNIQNNQEKTLTVGNTYKAVSYNIGFGAYTSDFGFFMDGGTEGRAWSYDSVSKTIQSIISLLKEQNADFIFAEEVDEKATRSYKINQHQMFLDGLDNYGSCYAINYDSPYLIYPFHSPLGSAKSGIMTLSKYNITKSTRKEFPVETGFSKFMDLDRCYTVSRVKVDGGKELVLFAIHLSAYTSDGTIADEQFRLLVEHMKQEYQKGNYVVCGGDFNKDLLGDSSKIFGVSGEDYTWAQPVKEEFLTDTGLSLVKPFNNDKPVPTCRNADGPYNPNQFVITIDGFIVSDNITVNATDVIDTGFLYSDHNPVYVEFTLN